MQLAGQKDVIKEADDLRKMCEREVRHEEYERNRPPESKWYEFKHNGFNKELYRNRVALKPNNENKVYLERLQDKDIY